MKNRLLGAFALCAAVFVANEAEAAAVNEGDGPAKAIIDIGCYECQIPAPGLMMLVK